MSTKTNTTLEQALALEFAESWDRLETRLDGAASIRGVTFREYRILRALAEAPEGRASRVELAAAVGLTPSGVTRALRPLEKLHIVRTIACERDARRSLAELTEAGEELLADVASKIHDTLRSLLDGKGGRSPKLSHLLEALGRGA